MKFITETIPAWQRLQQTATTGLPVVLYGTGNGADKIVDYCEMHNIAIAGIFVSDEFCRGQIFRGLKVERYSEITARLGNDFLLVIAFASELPDVLQRFQELSVRHPAIAPHLGLFDSDVVTAEWLTTHSQELSAAYELLADELSRQVFCDILNYKLSGKINYLFEHATRRQDDLQLLNLGTTVNYLDLGAYDGDTVQEFTDLIQYKYRQIVAVEADPKNYAKLQNKCRELPRFSALNAALWDKEGEVTFSAKSGRAAAIIRNRQSEKIKTVSVPAVTLDLLAQTYNLDGEIYVKFDIEGAELPALHGGRNFISQMRPKLLIAGYHYDRDIFRIPLYLHVLNPEYKIYLRKHPYVPAWEINFFAK